MEDQVTKQLLMATEAENTRIAIINNNISYIQKDISEIKLSLREAYATKQEFAQLEKDSELRLARLENASNLWRWFSPTLAAILGSILTFLLIQYIMNMH
jgi:hypothetical protein